MISALEIHLDLPIGTVESKTATLPIAREIATMYVLNDTKAPWFIDLLNINLNNMDLEKAKNRISLYINTLASEGKCVTKNLDFS